MEAIKQNLNFSFLMPIVLNKIWEVFNPTYEVEVMWTNLTKLCGKIQTSLVQVKIQ